MDADPWADAPAVSSPIQPSKNQLESPRQGSDETPTLANDDFNQDESFASTSTPPAGVPAPGAATEQVPAEGDGFGDDFDDFDAAPIAGPSGSGDVNTGANGGGDDTFGDFGDFEEGDFDAEEIAHDTVPENSAPPPIPEERLTSLSLHPFPSTSHLLAQISALLEPLLNPTSEQFTDEPPRLASSSRQILPTETARDAYIQLASPPQLKPLDWTRSRVRREHLIHMGIPVNLDEVDSHLLSKLPALTISTNFGELRRKERKSEDGSEGRRSGSLGPNGNGKGKEREVESGSNSALPRDTAVGGDGKYGLGGRPELDISRAEELCGVEEDQISILPPTALAKLQADLVESSAQASALLAYLLQLKDAQAHDSATYNGMISNLITNAANARSAQQAGSGGVFRRTSVRRPVSMAAGNTGANGSGAATPRTGSPIIR